ncbi:MAG: rhomboid family intramembrane serine protease [Candidatus Heimdallarchaeum endolithica]|uniref:Rhomboid family intramembrane serine protease n=1 Tax=Candidatus Heimdallarchaeum endolithica TaxID=2876572 RepID=A0A9Y1FPV3_9ARCH|nr:MAG: rhomboid family intramembrane serine protease [Candidatus Heimdallarchaeum endolithica]
MSDSETDETSIEDFWKRSSSTRDLIIVFTITYLVLTILSLTCCVDTGYTGIVKVISISRIVLEWVGQYNLLIFKGYVYELFSAMFVHANLLHLLSNLLFFLIYGLRADEKLYAKHFYIIFVVSALLGNLFTLVVYPVNTISCGASGGIFGLLGTDLILAYEEDKSKSIWTYLAFGIIFLLMSVGVNVNSLAHSIGLVSGILLTFFVIKKRK